MKRFGRPRFTENFTSSTTFEGSGISEAAAAEAAAVETGFRGGSGGGGTAERAAVRLPLPAPVGISVPPMPRVPASLQRGRGQGRGRPQGSKSRGPPSLHQNAVKARKCGKERAHNNSSERRCSLVRVLGRSRTCVLPQCSFNARPRRNTCLLYTSPSPRDRG